METDLPVEQDGGGALVARDYQVELFEHAMKENTLVCLGTGSGKTFIAIKLIEEYIPEIKVPFSKGGQRTFFVVPKVPLVDQQTTAIKQQIGNLVTVNGYVGQQVGWATEGTFWDKNKWYKEFECHSVIVLTAQILHDILYFDYIPLEQINLIVFDEAHHATGNNPYKRIMDLINSRAESTPAPKPPRILALTASIVNKNVKSKAEVGQIVRNLSEIYGAEAKTSMLGNSAQRHSTKPKEVLVRYAGEDLREFTMLRDQLGGTLMYLRFFRCERARGITQADYEVLRALTYEEEGETMFSVSMEKKLTPAENFVKAGGKMLKDVCLLLVDLGAWAAGEYAKKMEGLIRAALEGARHRVSSTMAQLLRVVATDLRFFYTCVERVMAREDAKRNLRKFRRFFSNKVNCLLEQLVVRNNMLKDAATAAATQAGQPVDQPSARLCGIVLVEMRCTALMLCRTITEIQKLAPPIAFIHCEFLTGHGASSDMNEETKMDVIKQREILKLFREDKVNVVIGTSVIEEGLDIRHCNVVCMFDFCKTARSYVQAKGRARAVDSHFLMLSVEADLMKNSGKVKSFRFVEEFTDSLLKKKEEFPASVAQLDPVTLDMLIPPYDPFKDDSPHDSEMRQKRAKITATQSISVFHRHLNKIAIDNYTNALVPKVFYVEMEKKPPPHMGARRMRKEILYQCRIKLPVQCGIPDYFSGTFQENKHLAKMSAAVNVCERLHKDGHLDNEHLLPVDRYKTQCVEMTEIAAMRKQEAMAQLRKPGTRQNRADYSIKLPKALEGEQLVAGSEAVLYVIVCKQLTDRVPDEAIPSRPFGFLCGKAIEDGQELSLNVPLFTISHLKEDFEVKIVRSRIPVHLDSSKLEITRTFNETVWKEVLKWGQVDTEEWLTFDPANSSLSVLPVLVTEPNDGTYEDCSVSWSIMERPEALSENDFVLEALYKKRNRKELFYVVKKDSGVSGDNAFVVEGAGTYREYYKNQYGVTLTGNLVWAKPIGKKMNMIVPRLSRSQLVCIPESYPHCNRHDLPASVWVSAARLPSVFYRIVALHNVFDFVEQIPVMSELTVRRDLRKPRIPGNPSAADLLGCITRSNCLDVVNMERMETLGDSFLKYSVVKELFFQNTTFNEGELTKVKGEVVSNYNLLRLGRKRGLPGVILEHYFDPMKDWTPPGFVRKSLDESPVEKESTRMSDKVVADSVEAFIGCFINAVGERSALDFMEWLGLTVRPTNGVHVWRCDDILGNMCENPYSPLQNTTPETQSPVGRTYERLTGVEERLGYTFCNKALLVQAMTHASKVNIGQASGTDSYERLEFLGDALLDYLITKHLYDHGESGAFKESNRQKNSKVPSLPAQSAGKKVGGGAGSTKGTKDGVRKRREVGPVQEEGTMSPGELTDVRSALVNNEYFGTLMLRLGLEQHVLHFCDKLSAEVMEFKEQWAKASPTAHPYDEEIVEAVVIPKVLGDVLEALVAAIYLDSDFDKDVVWKIFYPILKDDIGRFTSNPPKTPIRVLYELIPGAKISPKIEHDEKAGTHTATYDLFGLSFTATASQTKLAKVNAARKALLKKDELLKLYHEAGGSKGVSAASSPGKRCSEVCRTPGIGHGRDHTCTMSSGVARKRLDVASHSAKAAPPPTSTDTGCSPLREAMRDLEMDTGQERGSDNGIVGARVQVGSESGEPIRNPSQEPARKSHDRPPPPLTSDSVRVALASGGVHCVRADGTVKYGSDSDNSDNENEAMDFEYDGSDIDIDSDRSSLFSYNSDDDDDDDNNTDIDGDDDDVDVDDVDIDDVPDDDEVSDDDDDGGGGGGSGGSIGFDDVVVDIDSDDDDDDGDDDGY